MRPMLILAGRLHESLGSLEQCHGLLMQRYSRILFSTPDSPNASELQHLRRLHGLEVRVFAHDVSRRHAGLNWACELAAPVMHCADADHALRLVLHNLPELDRLLKVISHHDGLIVGRSASSLRQFPRALVETEAVINGVFSNILGQRVDLGGGMRGFRLEAARFLVKHDAAGHFLGADAVWPVLLHRAGFDLRTITLNGLSWAENHVLNQLEAGRLRDAYDAEPRHWLQRLAYAELIVRHGLEALERPLASMR